ncbi:MAG TPA: hypothetical protein VFK35_10340 [Candidatus Limnocylindrales bacterium]|nr:hypothetical protein [Candidatus Limnocylindrales bacterium]
MRNSNQLDRGRRLSIQAAGLTALLCAVALAGCGGTAIATGSPTPQPTPLLTPDPHLTEPVTADQIFRALGAAKVGIVANNANSGQGNPNIVKVINADVGSWPLRITEYRSSAILAKVAGWKPGAKPARNQAPYSFAGLNILIEYGSLSGAAAPKPPDATRQAQAAAIVTALDPLLWPLAKRTVTDIPSRTAEPAASAPAASNAP